MWYSIETTMMYSSYNRHMKIIVSIPYGHGNRILQTKQVSTVNVDLPLESNQIPINMNQLKNVYVSDDKANTNCCSNNTPVIPQGINRSSPSPDTMSHSDQPDASIPFPTISIDENQPDNSENPDSCEGQIIDYCLSNDVLDRPSSYTPTPQEETDSLLNDLISDDICRYTTNNQPYITINSKVPFYHAPGEDEVAL